MSARALPWALPRALPPRRPQLDPTPSWNAIKPDKNAVLLRNVERQLAATEGWPLLQGGVPLPVSSGASALPTLFDDLLPLLWTLRFLLILPVTVSRDTRTVRFRWLSWTTLVTAVLWLFTSAISCAVLRFRLAPVLGTGKHFHVWDVVPQYATVFGMSYIFFLPVACWATAGRCVALVELWQRVEALATAVTGPLHLPGLRTRARVYSLGSLVLPVLIQSMAMYVLPQERLWMVPAMLHTNAFVVVSTSFWLCCCSALGAFGSLVAARMPADLQRLGPQGLRAHRQIWLALAHLLTQLGVAWGRLQTLLLAVLFVSITSISFVITAYVLHGVWDKRLVWLGTVAFFVVIFIFSICNGAQIATDGVRLAAVRQLLALSVTHKDEPTCHEIICFLDDIRLERHHLTICKLGVLSRASLLSFFSLACTYVVVLSQFTLSSETSRTKFDKLPADLGIENT
ncbi:Gustatory receptor 7 [Frankliniella occidentalis]|uniref:Gustatory receptor n=1 Tax=Frankliniella occidentalis TaxID=133901 RepID=A0A9C6X3D2_FRAOC|nr:gustatory and odorant receptor 22-like [Frankliniella occidentalis]KAE8741510.1 Gustatory receptor 7 [Frankliniella occidentalis]